MPQSSHRIVRHTGEITLRFSEGAVVIEGTPITRTALVEVLAATLNHLAADPDLALDVTALLVPDSRQLSLFH